MDLHAETLQLMAEARLPVTRVCADVGVTTRWYYKLKKGEIASPGYDRLQRLHDYLAAHARQGDSDAEPERESATG